MHAQKINEIIKIKRKELSKADLVKTMMHFGSTYAAVKSEYFNEMQHFFFE